MTINVGDWTPLLTAVGATVVLATPVYRLFVEVRELKLLLQQTREDMDDHVALPSHPGTAEQLARLERILVEMRTDLNWIRRTMNGAVRDPMQPFRSE